MTPLFVLSLALAGVGTPYPDELDVLRTGGVRPRINLLLDSSCSMGWGRRQTACQWFANTHNGGSTNLDKNDQMRAVLVGCQAEGDGILDAWQEDVDFSVHDFRGTQADFGSSLEALRSAALGIPARGGTPLSRTLDRGGEYLNRFSTDANTDQCTPFFQLLLSDGNPNGGAATFNQECGSGSSRRVESNRPWEGSEYLYDMFPDLMCNMSGEQQVRTYTLGFGAPGDFNPMFLQRIAEEGGGTYYYASSVPELVGAFDSIMATVAAQGQPLAQIQVGRDLFFTGNRAYAVAYEPNLSGVWHGNLRRFCVFPPQARDGTYDTSVDTCMFRSRDGRELLTNPNVRDTWTGLSGQSVTVGGAGAVLRARLGGASPEGPAYWSKRHIVTWRDGDTSWTPVRPDTWTADDAHANGCEHARLINFLHGYTMDADCATGAPVAIRDWPLADAVHGRPLELRYDSCVGCVPGPPVGGGGAGVGAGVGAGINPGLGIGVGVSVGVGGAPPSGPPGDRAARSFVMLPTNDGLLHIFDAETGEETSAIVPAELWGADGVARSRLLDIPDQPSTQFNHRYFVDGIPELRHTDDDGDGLIDVGETAQVVFSLGRGGRAYYVLDVSDMADGVVDEGVRVQSLRSEPGSSFDGFEDTWAAPVFAQMQIGDERYEAGIFVSGHDPRFDVVDWEDPTGSRIRFVDPATRGETREVACAGSQGFADSNGYGVSGLCADFHEPGCSGTPQSPCYDGVGVPLDAATSPLTATDGVHQAAALRVYFSAFDLGAGDVLRLEDGQGNLVAEYRGRDLDGAWSAWVYDAQLALRLVSDGVDSRHRGYEIGRVEWELGTPFAELDPTSARPPVPGVDHRPALLVVDMDELLTPGVSELAPLLDHRPVLLEVARACQGRGQRCLDARDAPDLEHMVCAVSGEPAPYMSGGRLQAIYFGDECGQIFKVHTEDEGQSWTARRLVNLNSGRTEVDKDHRKIFRRLDVVDSVCPGADVVGIYFGTGNVQRPLAVDELEVTGATDGHDVVGVLWDRPGLPAGLDQRDFADATEVDAVDAARVASEGRVGWLMRLGDNERMLRDPVVVDGVAFFKTFEPSTSPQACELGSGVDRIYTVDNCSAEAMNPSGRREDRVAWSGSTGIGADLILLAPRSGVPLVSHGDFSNENSASLGRRRRTRPGLFMWRESP